MLDLTLTLKEESSWVVTEGLSLVHSKLSFVWLPFFLKWWVWDWVNRLRVSELF